MTHEVFRLAAMLPSTPTAVGVSVNYDPDMLLGNDNVDDPDLAPALGAQLVTLPWVQVYRCHHVKTAGKWKDTCDKND